MKAITTIKMIIRTTKTRLLFPPLEVSEVKDEDADSDVVVVWVFAAATETKVQAVFVCPLSQSAMA